MELQRNSFDFWLLSEQHVFLIRETYYSQFCTTLHRNWLTHDIFHLVLFGLCLFTLFEKMSFV